MTASLHDITVFIARAQEQGARWLLIACDGYDHDDYPIFVMPGADPYAAFPTERGTRVHEAYDLTLPIGAQLEERRAWHLPEMR